MSHGMTKRDAEFSRFSGRPAWHQLGETVPEGTSPEEFIRKMDYNVVKHPSVADLGGYERLAEMAASDSVYSADEIRAVLDKLKPIANQNHLIRDVDTHSVSSVTVSDGYGVLTPNDLYDELFADWIAQGWAQPDAFFPLYDGQTEVISVKLCVPEEFSGIEGDQSPSEWYAFGQNQHGRGSAIGTMAQFRVQCANTVSAAIGQGVDFRLRHTRNVVDRLKQSRDNWDRMIDRIAEYKRKCGILANTTAPSIETAVNEALGIDTSKPVGRADAWLRDSTIAASNDPENGTNGSTLYDVFNALSNTLTWSAKRAPNASKRMQSQLNGSRGKTEKAVFDRLVKMATSDLAYVIDA